MFAKFFLLFVLCFMQFVTPMALASPAADSLVEHFNRVETFKAEFTQTVHNKQSGSKETTSGSIIVKGERQFRLEYTKPYEQTYVADGEYLWFFDKELEQVTVRLQQGGMQNTPALILSQPARFIKQYQVSRVNEKGDELYTLFTRSEQTAFDKIYLRFRNNKLQEMTMYDNFGSETKLVFKNLDYNIKTTRKTFRFIVPKGVDVIRQYPDGNPDEY